MSDFPAKMHQIQFRLELRLDPARELTARSMHSPLADVEWLAATSPRTPLPALGPFALILVIFRAKLPLTPKLLAPYAYVNVISIYSAPTTLNACIFI